MYPPPSSSDNTARCPSDRPSWLQGMSHAHIPKDQRGRGGNAPAARQGQERRRKGEETRKNFTTRGIGGGDHKKEDWKLLHGFFLKEPHGLMNACDLSVPSSLSSVLSCATN